MPAPVFLRGAAAMAKLILLEASNGDNGRKKCAAEFCRANVCEIKEMHRTD
jgi:hypothetical protein